MYGNLSMAVALLTHTGIRDFRMSRMSGIEISSSQGLKKPPKISPRDVKLTLPRAVGPREVSFSSHGLILRFFSTRGMKKFLYLTSTAIRKTYSCLSLYMWKICFFREIVMRTRYPGGNYHFSPGKKFLPGEKLPFPPGWRVRTTISRKKIEKV